MERLKLQNFCDFESKLARVLQPSEQCFVGRHGYPGARVARLIDRFKNFLVPCAKRKIGKTLFILPDSLDKVVHFENLDIKVAQSASCKIKTKER